MANTKKISKVLKSYMNVASKPEGLALEGGGSAAPKPMSAMGDKLKGVVKIAKKRKEQKNKAQHRVRSMESKIFSAIGRVIGDAAELKEISPIDLLGLADYVAWSIEQSEIQLEIRTRGLAIYESNYARAKTLCMLGAVGSKDVAEALRAAGFVRVSDHWAGPANIVQAISIALEHNLTLLRHEGHDVIHYIRKGVRQPALAELEAEHDAMIAQVIAVLSPQGDAASREEATGDGGDAALPAVSQSSTEPEHKGSPGKAASLGPASAGSAGRSRMGFGRPAMVQPVAPEGNGNDDA